MFPETKVRNFQNYCLAGEIDGLKFGGLPLIYMLYILLTLTGYNLMD